MSYRLWILGAVLCAASCTVPESLDCGLLADPDNCWASAMAVVDACLPPGEVALFAADRHSCSYADGTTIEFDEVLPDSRTALLHLGLTIYKEGVVCARFEDSFEDLLRAGSDALSAEAELRLDGALELRCSDGTSYAEDFEALQVCKADLPADVFELDATDFTVSVVSAATPGPLFHCSQAGSSALR